jgi:hypothetical protein
MLRTAQLLPLTRAFDTALRRRAFPPGAGSLLPGPLAATRTGLTPAGNDELPTESDHVITQPLPNCRAYSRVSSNLRWRSAARDPRAGRFHIPSCPPVKTASRDGRRAPMPRSPLLGYQRAPACEEVVEKPCAQGEYVGHKVQDGIVGDGIQLPAGQLDKEAIPTARTNGSSKGSSING